MKSLEEKKLEKFAKGYVKPDPGRMVDNKLLSLVVNETLPWIKGPKVLEMGVGDDAWTEKIIKKFGSSNIVDAAEVILKRAKRKYQERINTFTSLFEEFEPSEKYNTIIVSYVLEHVKDPVEILKRAKTWIRPNGHLIIIVPHADSYHRRLAVVMGLQKKTEELGTADKKIGHRRVYTMKKMEADITCAGLKVFRKKGLFAKFLPQSLMTGWPDKLIKGYMDLGKKLPMECLASICYDCVLKNETKRIK